MGLALAVGAGNKMLGSGGGGMGGPPRMQSTYYGKPIKHMSEHEKRLLYGMQIMGPSVSKPQMDLYRKHNLVPPSAVGGLRRVPVQEGLRAIKIKENLDPEYLPDLTPRPPPAPPPAAVGAPVSVAPQAIPTDINAIQQQATSQQGLQPAGANLVSLLAQQQAARFSPNIQAIRQGFLTG
jgi:hypothetical protein